MSRTIRAAVLSAGAWSRSSHLPTLAAHPQVELVGVSSPDAGRAAELAAEFGAAHAETEWRRVLEHSPDVVVVSSPPVAHEEQVVAALAAGAHVLVEKPFALETSAARRMHDASVTHARALLVGFGWPKAAVFQAAKAMIDHGEIGEVEHLMNHLAVNTRALLGGGTDGGWDGATASRPETYTDRGVSGGGAAAVSMSHQLGLVSWLVSLPFDEITAVTYPPASEIDLHVSAMATFSTGAAAALSCASTHPYLSRPQWHLALYGSRGQLWVDSISDQLRLVRSDGEVVEMTGEDASGSYDPGAPTRALVECALGADVPAGMSSALAVHVVETTDALYRSAAAGRPERVGGEA